jgi:hypothetical protein
MVLKGELETMVYLIALLHGVPVLVVGLASNSKSRAIYTAIFMATLGAITGNPVYMAIDLLAVGLALWFCLAASDESSQSQAPEPNSPGWVSLGEANKPTEVSPGYVDHAERLAAIRAARPARRAIAVTVAPAAKARAKAPDVDGVLLGVKT